MQLEICLNLSYGDESVIFCPLLPSSTLLPSSMQSLIKICSSGFFCHHNSKMIVQTLECENKIQQSAYLKSPVEGHWGLMRLVTQDIKNKISVNTSKLSDHVQRRDNVQICQQKIWDMCWRPCNSSIWIEFKNQAYTYHLQHR